MSCSTLPLRQPAREINSLDAFLFVAPGGNVTPVRWSTAPAQSSVAQMPSGAAGGDKDYLFEDLISRVHEHPLQWHLLITIFSTL
ncbi:MAG TPA: hypothetical protein VNO35_27380 [Steroidobacteraceae bacterium]|nr:hypothetical protein [Steroidobacteraceae bacterium]